MSAPASELHLEALQCHFTWDLSSERWMLLRLREKLLDICPEESNPWRGHIYNLLGFVQTRLGCPDEALSLFTSASEDLMGPALLVNNSNLAWLHHKRGETALSHEYLMRVEELNREYPTGGDHSTEKGCSTDPTEEPLHPEVLAEKAWTLMKFGPQQRRVATELFEQALEEQPERVEWRSSQAIALMSTSEHTPTGVTSEELLKVQRAQEEDPENMFLAVKYLSQRAKRGEQVEEEVAELVPQIIPIAHSSYSGLKSVLKYYRLTKAVDEAISCAEEALEKHPESRYVKSCAALCYKWRLVFSQDARSQRHLMERGVSLTEEVISLYPDTALIKELDLAVLYGKSEPAKAEELYQTLFQRQMEPPETQLLYYRYAKHHLIILHDRRRAIRYYQRAAGIDHDSLFREQSLDALQELQRRSSSTHLEELQCHFTWEMDRNQAICFTVRDKLEDLLLDESNPWRGHIYNLLGFVQTRLGRSEEALSLFTSASEALRGPALLVNYSNLAWLHHERGETALSHEYLQRVEALSREYPTWGDHSTERDHPEVLAEKAFSLTHFNNDRKRLAGELWEKALGEDPGRVEWCSAQVLALLDSQRRRDAVDEELFTKIRQALHQDPENLELRAEYLRQCAKRGQEVGPEAGALAAQVLLHPDRIHRVIRTLLELYRRVLSLEAAIDLAVKALDTRPDSRYLKACLAMCYKWRILQREAASQELIGRAVSLFHEVVSLYPDSCLLKEIELADICAKSKLSRADAARIYNKLLRRDLEDDDKQMLFNCYAKFLRHEQHDFEGSVKYHMRAAEIPWRSFYRANSIEILQRNQPRNDGLRRQVEQFLRSLQDP